LKVLWIRERRRRSSHGAQSRDAAQPQQHFCGRLSQVAVGQAAQKWARSGQRVRAVWTAVWSVPPVLQRAAPRRQRRSYRAHRRCRAS
jgi:hypothetical protein